MAGEPYNEIVYKAGEKIIAGGNGTTTSPNVVVGNVAAGVADSGAPVKVGGIYSATLPTLVTAQRGNVQLTERGAVVTGMSGLNQGLTASYSSLVSPYTHQSLTGAAPMAVGNYVFNGTNVDLGAKPNAASRIPSSANTTNATSAKASSGNLFGVYGYNSSATVTYLKIYNKASAPTVGTDTPVLTLPLAPTSVFEFSFASQYFATGIAYGLTTDAADAGTTAVAAGAILGLNVAYA